MSVSSIGIQMITPQTGTSPVSPPQQQADERERVQPIAPKQAPPPPPSGTGQYVDRTA